MELSTVQYLRTTVAIREQCHQLLKLACTDQLPHFRCDLTQLGPTADYVIAVTQSNYPTFEIPFHSRWRHFEVGQPPRIQSLVRQLNTKDKMEAARCQFDLAITSVLLDAGAGSLWRYTDPVDGTVYTRSEGLAVASFDFFMSGSMSSSVTDPLSVDAAGLQQLTLDQLSTSFQVTQHNPLVGLDGRLALLQSLGHILMRYPHLFGSNRPRPGHLVDYLTASGSTLSATAVLAAVLDGFSDIWPGRVTLNGVNLGDVWSHSALDGLEPGSNLIPFHKLSQWLTYSLLEPLQHLGLTITSIDDLTGLAEYRNGGLCLDYGLIQPKDDGILGQAFPPGSEVIVEWRALTVALLDHIANEIRHRLQLTADQLPLARILQGGTWAAGRQLAQERRQGSPPIQLRSDGTVF